MKERLEAALKYEQGLMLYEKGEMSQLDIIELWHCHAKFIMDEIADEAMQEYLKQYKDGLT